MKQPKPKKCKNPSCGKVFTPNFKLQRVCSVDCAYQLARIESDKKQAKEAKVQKAEMKESIKSLSDYKNDLQREVNLIARLIDQDCPCVSSGRSSGKMSGGHRLAVGGWGSLRFHLMNIWIQSFHDNHHLSGNPSGYDVFLRANDIYGIVHDLPKMYPFIKLQKGDLKEKIVIARQIVKDVKELNMYDDLPRNADLRIEMRVKYNKLLGIYT